MSTNLYSLQEFRSTGTSVQDSPAQLGDHMNTIETFKQNGYTVKLVQDPEPQSLADEGADDLFLVTTNNRYFVVKTHKYLKSILAGQCATPQLKADLEKAGFEVRPLYAYIHSGIALSLGREGQFGDQWDSRQIGFVCIGKSAGITEEAITGYIKTWNQYLSGDVSGYQIETPNGDHVDSCWGFFGLDYCREAAKAEVPAEPAIDEIEEDSHEELEALAGNDKDRPYQGSEADPDATENEMVGEVRRLLEGKKP